ncbi:general secretion pathway protein E [Photobacterium aphoticum]|uniref:General secretion pathway protein E n=1 Tax=Photobacterium aphoticum TaxID=754436 RepID=A0A090RJY6_9GAMM|nr:general secretion pathway protein E [Photobacterium aphoticum]
MEDARLQPEAQPRFRLPFSFAKRHRVVLEMTEQDVTLFYTGQLSASVLTRSVVSRGGLLPE